MTRMAHRPQAPYVKKHGLITAGGALDKSAEVSVYLNDKDVTRFCKCADDELGFVVLAMPKEGVIKRSIHFGEVQIFACEKEG